VDQKGQVHNDIWLIEPHYSENETVIQHNTFEFMQHAKHQLSIKIKKISNYGGKPPCPRIMHSALVFKDWNKHFNLVIYGGRND